jgi:hypothetical protein
MCVVGAREAPEHNFARRPEEKTLVDPVPFSLG